MSFAEPLIKTLSIGYVTAREKPNVQWFIQSLSKQIGPKQVAPELIVIDALKDQRPVLLNNGVKHVDVKTNFWSGKHRLTKDQWWSKAAALNTFLCMARGEWLCCVDDRCVLMPGFFEAIGQAMKESYAVAGAYEKRSGMAVERGVITKPGTVTGEDGRFQYLKTYNHTAPFKCGGSWLFGCINAMPRQAAINANGWPEEVTDGLGMEDVAFGSLLENAGVPIKYDPRLKIIEDRTPSENGPVMHKTDKGVSPNDKSHAVLALLKGATKSPNSFQIRDHRKLVLQGKGFPLPSRKPVDWYDGQPLSEMKAP